MAETLHRVTTGLGFDEPVTHIYTEPNDPLTTFLSWTNILGEIPFRKFNLESPEIATRVATLAQVDELPFVSTHGFISANPMAALMSAAMQGKLLNSRASPTTLGIMESTVEVCQLLREAQKPSRELRDYMLEERIPECLSRIEILLKQQPGSLLDTFDMVHVSCGVLHQVLTNEDNGPYQREEISSCYPTIVNVAENAIARYTRATENLCGLLCQ